MAVAENLKKIRKTQRVTQVELAKRTGLSQATISAYETGVSAPSLGALEKLADALGVEYGDILGDRPKVPPLPPTLSLAALSPEELETRLFGAPAREGQELAPVLTVEEAHRLVRTVRGERDALEDWGEAYTAAPPEDRLRARLDNTRAKESLAWARLYYVVLLDYWSKLADPRGVPFKGVWQIVSERAEAYSLMEDIKRYQDERRHLAKGKAG